MLVVLAAVAAACALAPLGASLGALACRVARSAGSAASSARVPSPGAGSPYRRVERACGEALPAWMARVLERQARRRANFCVSAAHTTPGA